MKKFYLILIIILLPVNLFSNGQRIIPVGSEIYTLLDLLSIETGYSVLSRVKPYSEAQVFNILEEINTEQLSDAGKKAVERINKLTEKTPLYSEEDFSVDLSASTAFELYLHSSDDESQWQYGYEQRLPFLTLSAETWFNEGFYALIEPDLKESRFLIDYTDSEGNSGNITNIPGSFGDVNYYFPDRGFFSLGSNNWNLQLGRDSLEYGNGETGSLLISSYPDYYNFLKIKGFVDNFAFTWSYINLENWPEAGTDIDPQRFIVDHALEVRLFNILTLSVNESALYYGENSELQFIGPLIIYHNLFNNHFADGSGSNICMTLGFDIVPLSGLSLYGEYLLDEVQTGLEKKEYGEGVAATPNANAYLLGLKGALPLGSGYLSGFFEYIYTSPWCYLLNPEGGSIVWTHNELTDVLNKKVDVYKPLGYEYGPDTITFTGKLGYVMPGFFDAFLTAEYVLKGENTILTEFSDAPGAAQMTTPSGVSENKLVIGLNGTIEIFEFLSAGIDIAFLNIRNYQHIQAAFFTDFQSAASLIFKI